MREINFTELEAEHTELLPTRETLFFNNNWAAIYASNSSLALNAASLGSAGQQRRRPDDRRHAGLISRAWPPTRGPRLDSRTPEERG